MPPFTFPARLQGFRVHLVGAKGTGVCALAELLVRWGARVSGSDVSDRFYTDTILAELGISIREFSADAIDDSIDLVVFSAAYNPQTHPELIRANELGIPIASYPEALGAFSRTIDSSGICGVHGKTTTTALAGVIAKALDLPATVLAGSAVSSFGDRSTMYNGDRFFIAETCEYRRHFLQFSPGRILLTSVESDHQDYYPDYNSILQAFVEYMGVLPQGGYIIYCADDAGAKEALGLIRRTRTDLRIIPYGFSAEGAFRIQDYSTGEERAQFHLALSHEAFSIRVPGRHIALDATGALALCSTMMPAAGAGEQFTVAQLASVRTALEDFRGSRRRSEILGEARGVLFMDDYAHHPGAIRTTLAGLREFYPGRRLVVDFMSHTYSRTKALFSEFASSFSDADSVIAHRIYASARETPDPAVSGRSLAQAITDAGVPVIYFEEPMEALDAVASDLRPGDLFLTMGAGDNWKLGAALYDRFKTSEGRNT